ncbi:MAG: rhodanese-like domain-containing protein [Chitinophagaceae bacterium]|jgi:rhodanese-related sulfurtransferase|nr:rhodanese-like domain-containing protein [Chitinophagaceae bacterium]
MKQQNTIIDVRTKEEFSGGHVEGSINIPLHEIPHRLAEIKKMEQPLILCCASGNRSGQAMAYLKRLGIECNNGGSWLKINFN